MSRLRQRGVRHVITSSAGNHGAGVAFAAKLLAMKATIVVPKHTPKSKLTRLRQPGVTFETADGGYDAAERVARELSAREQLPFLSPYAAQDIALGNGASIAYEITQSLGHMPDQVVVPVGGGGLASGLAWGLAAIEGAAARRRVWCVQSEASPAFALSCRDGRAWEQLDTTVATAAEGLEGGIEQEAFERAMALVHGVSVVSEDTIRQALLWLRARQMRVEGSAAVVVALALRGKLPESINHGNVVFLLTGRNVDS